MGFPNVDIFLVSKLLTKFLAAKAAPSDLVSDLFEEMDAPYRTEVTTYLTRKTFTKDLRTRSDNAVFLMPHFPLLDMPLPQIGISLGDENPAERYLGDVVGDAKPYPATGTTTHWDIPKGYWAQATYQIDVAAATKDETVWLSRMVQRFILEEQSALDAIGVKEINLSLRDARIAPEHAPMMVFNRQIHMAAKVANTWTTRIAAGTYQTGINTGLQ